jgi:hypothetical protein
MGQSFRSKAGMGMDMGMGMGGAITAVAATTTVGTAAITMVGTGATTMVGGIIAIGDDFHL